MNPLARSLETLGAWLLALLWILPLAYALWAAFHPSEFSTRFVLSAPLTFANFTEAWNAAPFARYLVNTVLLVTMILQIIGTAQVFLEPYLFTSGGPANATLTVLLQIYNYAFGNSLGGDYGKATALSLMLAGFLAVFSLVYLRATRSWSQD